jgi:hypothetical protein
MIQLWVGIVLSEGFPTRFTCGNDRKVCKTRFVIPACPESFFAVTATEWLLFYHLSSCKKRYFCGKFNTLREMSVFLTQGYVLPK